MNRVEVGCPGKVENRESSKRQDEEVARNEDVRDSGLRGRMLD